MSRAVSTLYRAELIPASSPRWQEYFSAAPHDFFQTAEYHALCAAAMQGEPLLLLYGTRDKFVAWPYVMQTIDQASRSTGEDAWRDATCVYGFSGPVSLNCEDDPAFLSEAFDAFLDVWREQRMVSIFARFHPILMNHEWFRPDRTYGIRGETQRTGATVYIDLSQAPSQIWDGYDRKLRQSIRQVERANDYIALPDPNWEHLDEFIAIYHATMKRNRVAPFLFFSRDYFLAFKEALGPHGSLYLGVRDGKIIAGFLLIEYKGIATVFLAGSDETLSRSADNKFLFNQVQRFARSRGNKFLHFGGGRGGRDNDSLFAFKAQFASTHPPFYTARWILNPGVYESLVDRRRTEAQRAGGQLPNSFFPAYRAPISSPLEASETAKSTG